MTISPAELDALRTRAAQFLADNPPPPLTDQAQDALALLRPNSTGGVDVEPRHAGTSQPNEAA